MGFFDFLTNQTAPSAPQGPASPRPPADSSWQIKPLDDEALDELHSQIKSAKFSRDKIQQAVDLVSSGKAMPGTREYYHALGIGAAQQGLKPADSYGGLGWLGNMFDPKAAELRRVQDVADNIGNAALKATVDLHTSQIGAPKTIAEAEAAAPGAVTPTAAQRFSPAPYAEGLGITPPADPNARLLPFQRAQAVNTATGVAQGHLMRTDEGIVPANYATYNGRYMMDPTDVVSSVKAATGVDIQPPAKPVPATNVNSMIQALSAGSRQDQRLERPVLDKDVNAMSVAMFKAPYYDLEQPQQAAVMDAVLERWQGRTKFANDQYTNRQLNLAGKVAELNTAGRAKAERAQPIGGDVTKYAKISADGLNIDRPNDPSLTQDDLIKHGYVDVSKFHTQVEGINDLDVIAKDLKKLKGYADILFTAQPGLGNAIQQAGSIKAAKLTNGGRVVTLKDGRKMTLGELANLYDREVQSTLDYYGKKLKGAVGTQTEPDTQRMAQNFAGAFTSATVKDALMADTQKLITDRRHGLLSTVFGQDAVTKAQSGKAPAKQTAESRYNELKKSGMKDDAIYKKLHQEGY